METVIRGASVYLVLLVIMRVSGRRTLSELTAFDFVLLLIIAETTQQALLGDDFSIINSFVLISTLIGIDLALAILKQLSPRADRLLQGVPTVLVRNGRIDRHALRRARVDEEEILAAGRQKQGVANMDEIEHAVLETDSGISVIPRRK